MNDQPLVSIIIPVYNGANYLREAIDSALAQTYPNCEVLVINDGSTDGGATEAIALSYGEKIRYFHKENGGVSSALNLGIREMRGEYFAWLSHDDVYCPEKTAVEIKASLDAGDDVVVFSDYDTIDENTTFIRYNHAAICNDDIILTMFIKHLVNGCTILIKKTSFDLVGLFDEKLKTTQDYDMWFRLAEHYRFVHVPSALVKYRVHSNQGTLSQKNHHKAENQLYIDAINNLPARYLQGKIEQGGASIYWQLSFHLRRRGYLQAADFAYDLARTNFWKGSARNLPRVLFYCAADSFVRYGCKSGLVRNFVKRINRIFKFVD